MDETDMDATSAPTWPVWTVLLVAFGVVGQMDYEGALEQERLANKVQLRLACKDAIAGAGLDADGGNIPRAFATATLPTTDEPKHVLSCVVLNE